MEFSSTLIGYHFFFFFFYFKIRVSSTNNLSYTTSKKELLTFVKLKTNLSEISILV